MAADKLIYEPEARIHCTYTSDEFLVATCLMAC